MKHSRFKTKHKRSTGIIQGEKVLIHHNSGFVRKIITYHEDYPSKTIWTRKERRETCSALLGTRRLMFYVLKIKINYIYLHQSPLKKFSFCTIFSLQFTKRASLSFLFCGRLVMCLVEKWSIRFSEEPSFDRRGGIWNWHAKVLVMRRVFLLSDITSVRFN